MTGAAINNWLISVGLLEIIRLSNGKQRKGPTTAAANWEFSSMSATASSVSIIRLFMPQRHNSSSTIISTPSSHIMLSNRGQFVMVGYSRFQLFEAEKKNGTLLMRTSRRGKNKKIILKFVQKGENIKFV